ncbi:MAG: GNAT family N-acetyltransferase [Halolamina sp.]
MTTGPGEPGSAPAESAEEAEEATVRQATEADLLAVYRIEKASFPEPWPYASFERFLGESGFLVATVADSVVGFIVGDVTPNYGRDIGHVKDLAVHPDVRGRGFGKRLLTGGVVRLSVAGADVVKLEVRVGNEPARSLYEAFGFGISRTVPSYYDNGEAAHVMTLDVAEWEAELSE